MRVLGTGSQVTADMTERLNEGANSPVVEALMGSTSAMHPTMMEKDTSCGLGENMKSQC